MASEPVKVLTIAGSDSGGAAGLQADLKTWTALGVYGMSVITAVTAQNSIQVDAVQFLSPDFVSAQLESVLSDYGAHAAKSGFIGSAELISVISQKLRTFKPSFLVVDPVLVNQHGIAMFSHQVTSAYRNQLLPLANLITPNWREASLLTDLPLEHIQQQGLITAIERLHAMGTANVLITGTCHDELMIDYYSDGSQLYQLPTPKIKTHNRHGSGDTLSAAICAFLAQGRPMLEAITQAQRFTANALRTAAPWQLGQGHGPLSHFSCD
jgi:hydroxymethylpyrimidine kinase/phosphomethylpyrimidine kinase